MRARIMLTVVLAGMALGLSVAARTTWAASDKPGALEAAVQRVRPAVVTIETDKEGAAQMPEPPERRWRFRWMPESRERGPHVPPPELEFKPYGPFVIPPLDEMWPPELRRQMPWPQRLARRAASGCILDAEGHVLTVHHAVDGADEITVTLHDGRRLEAELVGADEDSDLAVLRIEAGDLPAVQLGDSDALRVGQTVFAVGNPPQLPGSIAQGVVSGLHRSGLGVAEYEEFIQTDMALGDGFAGGPLADLDGRVVGINVAVEGERGARRGWAFAIPVGTVRAVLDDLLAGREVARGWLGVAISDVTPEMAGQFGYEGDGGALVQDVLHDSPAEQAALEAGDIIVAYRSGPVRGVHDLRGRVAATPPGTQVTLTVWRDGEVLELSVELSGREERPGPHGADRLGLEVQKLTPEIAEHLGRPHLEGVLVADVDPDGPAADQVAPGDVILSVNRQDVASVADYRRLLEAAPEGGEILLRVLEGETGRARFLMLSSR